MGKAICETTKKCQAIAAPLPALYQAIEEVRSKSEGGKVELDIYVSGTNSTAHFSSDLENPQELLEILRLAIGE